MSHVLMVSFIEFFGDFLRKKFFLEWQDKCLSNSNLVNGENYILALPTGSGKTLIAELLILWNSLIKFKSSILILPYVAIVQEKV